MLGMAVYKLKHFKNETLIQQSAIYTDSFWASDCGCMSVLARFTTGFWAYNTVAADTMKMAITVYMSIAMPKIIQHSTAVNISSSALAKVFRIEFKLRRNRLVTIPMAALFTTMISTPGCKMAEIFWGVNAVESSPLNPNTTALHTMESRYIKTFCNMMWTSTPLSFSRYSLYTPAKQELNTWTMMRRRWGLRYAARGLAVEAESDDALLSWPYSLMIQPKVRKISEIHWFLFNFLLNITWK